MQHNLFQLNSSHNGHENGLPGSHLKDVRPSTSRSHSRPLLSSNVVDDLRKNNYEAVSPELKEMSSISEFVDEYSSEEKFERHDDGLLQITPELDHRQNPPSSIHSTDQSPVDPALIEMQQQLQSRDCAKEERKVWSIKDAKKNPQAIDEWIQCMKELQKAKHSSHFNQSGFPSFEELSRPLPLELKRALQLANDQNVRVPDPNLNIKTEDYAKIICCLLNIPVYEGSVVHSIHQMIHLYLNLEAMKLESL
jgi:intraflagellar transport protein 46